MARARRISKRHKAEATMKKINKSEKWAFLAALDLLLNINAEGVL